MAVEKRLKVVKDVVADPAKPKYPGKDFVRAGMAACVVSAEVEYKEKREKRDGAVVVTQAPVLRIAGIRICKNLADAKAHLSKEEPNLSVHEIWIEDHSRG